jgi:uncharacterized RDD family membrane protein YckC
MTSDASGSSDARARPQDTFQPSPSALAGFWVRFLASFLDGLVLTVIQIVGFFLGAYLLEEIVPGLGLPLVSLLSFALGPVYFTVFHSRPAGQTLGDKAVGIRVVHADTGGALSAGSAFVRWLVSLVSGFALFLGYLWMLWDGRKQTWHDKAANSLVVRASAHPPAGQDSVQWHR